MAELLFYRKLEPRRRGGRVLPRQAPQPHWHTAQPPCTTALRRQTPRSHCTTMIKCVSYNNNHDATTITTINNNHLNNTHTINNNHTTRAVAVSAGSICFAHPVRDSDSGVSLYLSPSLYLSLSLYIYIYSVRIVYGIQYIAHNIYIYIINASIYIYVCAINMTVCILPAALRLAKRRNAPLEKCRQCLSSLGY